MRKQIVVHEVGLRDGLQMEHTVVPFEEKLRWVDQLIDSGVDIIQLGSFVHPTKVPQMADTDKLFRHVTEVHKDSRVIFSGLVLNEKGLDRGFACGVEMLCMGVSASETHSMKNAGMSIAEAVQRIIAMGEIAIAAGKKVQVSVQSAFGCGYEGAVPEERVLDIVKRYLDAGLTNISLADTAGHAVPDRVASMFGRVFALSNDVDCACHFHNTYGAGLANCYAAMNVGVKYFESSVAGLGGCPFTRVAGGNVCTEDFVHMLQGMDLRDDIKLDLLIDLANDMARFFGREMPGMVHKVGTINEAVARSIAAS
jgi:hydroxymethylglutaryl-CoA lyase